MSIQADIDRAIVITAQIDELKAELKPILARIEAAALRGPHEPLEDSEREGKQYRAAGTGKIVPVIITSDNLVQSFKADSKQHIALLALLNGDATLLQKFYSEERTFETRFKDGKQFRAKALELLGDKDAPKFITACVARDKHGIAKNAIKIDFSRAELKGAA